MSLATRMHEESFQTQLSADTKFTESLIFAKISNSHTKVYSSCTCYLQEVEGVHEEMLIGGGLEEVYTISP